MTELTEYLIELGKMLGIDTDTEGCVNPNLALSARIVLAIGELRQPLKWKDVADGLPEVDGNYNVKWQDLDGGAYDVWHHDEKDEENKQFWHLRFAAYIPVPISEYVKGEKQ